MFRALYTAATGMQAQQTNLDTIANNLSNSSTTGFSPTIGIIGAVLGLIQVMQHLDKIDEVGKGIAYLSPLAMPHGLGSACLSIVSASTNSASVPKLNLPV